MLQKELAKIFNRFADIYEILGDELEPGDNKTKYRIRAYRQAALTLENLSKDLAQIAKAKELDKLPGIGSIFVAKITEYISTGKIQEYNDLLAKIPKGLLNILELHGIGPKKVKLFYSELGITTIEDLVKAVKSGEIAELPRMGEKSANKILDAVERFQSQPDRFPLFDSLQAIETIISNLQKTNLVDKIDYAGSARRQQSTNGDIDIICASKDPEKIMDAFLELRETDALIARGPTKISVYLKSGQQADLRVVKLEEFGAAIQYFSGSKAHNVELRKIAKQQGYKINEYGIYKGAKKVGGAQEAEIYETLGLKWIPPELRENTGELELARQNKLPKLIEAADLIGDLHMHSTYSDGKHSIMEMAAAAQALGHKYIAITDHSPGLGVANGVSIPDLKKKKAEIAKLNQTMDITILYGTEVDILTDGSLDYPDEILAEFDIVVASIHSALPKDNTERIIKAMQHPSVQIIGHPSTRLLGKREGSPNNWSKIFQTAKETNTILEINASPYRLDLTGELVGQAATAGCLFSINTDAHNSQQLENLYLGIGQARRGGLTAKQVINTYDLAKMRKLLKKP